MNKELLLKKMADLAVKVGVNIQPGQMLVINAPIEAKELVHLVASAAYLAGSGKVIINWNDDYIDKLSYLYLDLETLSEVPDFIIDKLHYVVDKHAAFLSILSPNPTSFMGVDPKKLAMSRRALGQKANFYREHISSSRTQWSIIAYPNDVWSKIVFPELSQEEANDKLFKAIMTTSRVEEDTDPVSAWQTHVDDLARHNELLNKYNFKSLHFKNNLGTDLEVELVKNHIWAGGSEKASDGVIFVPNIPTEETFTMPLKTGVNGKVVSTKPLLYNGNIIDNFYLIFKDGKVVDYNAEKGVEHLKYLLETDEGSSYLGEVALISHDSPISKLNILFSNTLFDENASCHLALGNAYSMNVVNGTTMEKEEYINTGANISNVHVDFMFGSSDMEIEGTTQDGKKIAVFKKGNFVF